MHETRGRAGGGDEDEDGRKRREELHRVATKQQH